MKYFKILSKVVCLRMALDRRLRGEDKRKSEDEDEETQRAGSSCR